MRDSRRGFAHCSEYYETVFIDCPGYHSAELKMTERDPEQVIAVELSRKDP